MQIDYKRDLNSNYMILRSEGTVDTNSYQFRMVQANQISGLLPIAIREMDNQTMFYYDITSCQSLHAILEHHMVSCKMMRDLFRSLFQVLDTLENYLLSPDHLLLQADLIYADGSWENYAFVFWPGDEKKQRSIQDKMISIMETILPRLDHSNKEGVALGYGIYRALTRVDFSLDELKRIVYQNSEEDTDSWESQKETIGMEGPAYRTDAEWELEENENRHRMIQKFFDSAEEDMEEEKQIGKQVLLLGTVIGSLFLLGGIGSFFLLKKGILGIALLVFGAGILCFSILGQILTREGNEISEHVFVPEEDEFDRMEQKKEEKSVSNLYELTEVLYVPQTKKRRVRLIPENPDYPEISFEQKKMILVGKLESAVDFVIPVQTVSRMHAKLELDEEGVLLSDLNSRNGTFVNQELLQNGTSRRLVSGDEIEFADVRYVFEGDDYDS